MTFESYADAGNVSLGTSSATGALLFAKSFANLNPESFSGNNNMVFVSPGVYSLSNLSVITLSPGAVLNYAGSTTATAVTTNGDVPLPPAAFAGLAGLGALALRRRRA